ncbi:hypothetical protein C7212DRAFT_348316 [Tuber magnatum]|uniref:FabD/lysophospholipase-like protein n=1 Tax=Tuber magnatum TaxID=42249 RepID=A0A317SEV5_9PEZI|nr:hypothetical protein C7212DRAFT_348316 [Tuber magnatum]
MSLSKHSEWLDFANNPQRTTFQEANRLEALALHEFPNPNVPAPSLLSLVGGCHKSVIMRKLVAPMRYPSSQACGIHIHPHLPTLNHGNPILLADCPISGNLYITSYNSNCHEISQWSLSWSASLTVGEELAPAFLARSLLLRLLMPFSHVLCFYTADHGGLQGLAETMQALMDKGQGSNLSSLIAPKPFVIWENDEILAYADLIASHTTITEPFSFVKASRLQIKPPIAGIRLLCMDGGGVQRVLPLKASQQIKNHVAELAGFHSPIQDFFDVAYGTSSGYQLAQSAVSSSRVAVGDVARCTSAASWFFSPMSLPGVETFQDGGLRHNNPVNIALWELLKIWPESPGITDMVLSLGTGLSSSDAKAAGPWGILGDGFISHLYHSFMSSLDGERTWVELHNRLPKALSQRYFRCNMGFSTTEPQINDLKARHLLNNASINQVECATKIRKAEWLNANTFYFELDGLLAYTKGQYECLGYISCSRKMTHQKMLLKKITSQTAFFLVGGKPLTHFQAPEDHLLYCQPIKFSVQDLSQELTIDICSSCTEKMAISWFLSSMMQIIQDPSLGAVFNTTTTLKRKTTNDIHGGPKAKYSRPPYYQI